MQLSFILFFALFVQVLSTDPPVASTSTDSTSTPSAPAPKKYEPGDMIVASPKHWGDKKNKAFHPGVIVGQNPHNQKYKVAQISAKMPLNKYRHRDDAIKYHPNASKPGSKINIGKPVEVAEEHLRAANPDHWHKMEPEKLASLMKHINKHCPNALTRRGLGCPGSKPDKKAPKGKSRQHNGKKKSASHGKSRQHNGKKASRPVSSAKVFSKPKLSALKSKSRKLNGKKA